MTWPTVIGILGGAAGAVALVALLWRLFSWGRSDTQRAAKWEVNYYRVVDERDAAINSNKGLTDDLATVRAQYAALHASFTRLATLTISSATDEDAVRLAGGDGPAARDIVREVDFGEGAGGSRSVGGAAPVSGDRPADVP